MAAQVPLGKTLIKVVPLAFVLGGAIEVFMTYVRVGNETFYETAKRLEANRRQERRQHKEDLERRVLERQLNSAGNEKAVANDKETEQLE